jgi:hypothetical protein
MGRPRKVKKYLTQWDNCPEWHIESARINAMPEWARNAYNEKGYTELASFIVEGMFIAAKRGAMIIPKCSLGFWMDKMGMDSRGLLRQLEERGMRHLVES